MKRLNYLVLSHPSLIYKLKTLRKCFLGLCRETVYTSHNFCHVDFCVVYPILYHELLCFGMAFKNGQFVLIFEFLEVLLGRWFPRHNLVKNAVVDNVK